jgi:DNA-binding GntR family transcriptional regulator
VPGIVYSAFSLVEQFGVSVTPVREAMLDLASEGQVEALHNMGFRVIKPSQAQLDSITEVNLEVPAVRAVAKARADPSDIKHQRQPQHPRARSFLESILRARRRRLRSPHLPQ